MKKHNHILLPGTLLLMLAGCTTVGPDYTAPTPTDVLKNAAMTGEVNTEGSLTLPPEITIDRWWEAFNDPILTAVLTKTFENNRTFTAALESVREARARLRSSEDAFLPMTDLGGGYQRSRTSENGMSALRRYNSYTTSFDMAWELDVFGGLKRALEASEATLEAEKANLQYVWVTLSAEAARTYIELRTLQKRLEVAEENLAQQTSTYDLLKSLYDSGLGDGLAMSQSTYNLETTRATIPQIKAGIEATLNALAVFTGHTPDTLPQGIRTHISAIPNAPGLTLTGIPAETLRRRPDVAMAERQLAAATAMIGVATADLYPRFYLNGSLGLESLHSGSFLEAGSRRYAIGPVLSWPVLFKARQIRNNIEIANAQERQAYATYEHTLLTALSEVRTALSDYSGEIARNQSLKDAVAAAREAVDIAQDQYKNGLTSFNSVLDAQRSLFGLQESQALCEGNIATALVRMYKAFSGGYTGGLSAEPPVDLGPDAFFAAAEPPAEAPEALLEVPTALLLADE